jgi:NADH-quinone oxidoreductase subunit I
MGYDFEMADFRYSDLVYGKGDMLVEVQGTKPQRREAKYTGQEIKRGYAVPYVRDELEGVKAPVLKNKRKASAMREMEAHYTDESPGHDH